MLCHEYMRRDYTENTRALQTLSLSISSCIMRCAGSDFEIHQSELEEGIAVPGVLIE